MTLQPAEEKVTKEGADVRPGRRLAVPDCVLGAAGQREINQREESEQRGRRTRENFNGAAEGLLARLLPRTEPPSLAVVTRCPSAAVRERTGSIVRPPPAARRSPAPVREK